MTMSRQLPRLSRGEPAYGGPMTVARLRLGRRAEELVAASLERQGAQIVAANVRPAGVRGEIDLIALENGALVFVEVKARSAGSVVGPETPLLALDRRKQLKLRRLAAAWLREAGDSAPSRRQIRFDVVGLRVDDAGHVVEWDHVRGAF